MAFATTIPQLFHLTPSQKEVCETLAYFHVFNYPLSKEEIYQYCSQTEAITDGFLSHFKIPNTTFFGWNLDEKAVLKRIKGNEEAQNRLKKGLKRARFIGRFPFVRSVAISGSLSKGYMEKNSDIDFFIITQPGRLWVARTLLVAYKKIFLLNSRRSFCVNYFVDTDHLEIEEKNRFTATEIVTLIPSYGTDLFEGFIKANHWAHQQFPNKALSDNKVPHKKTGLKKTNEWMLSGRLGNALDARFMKVTFKRWKKKFGHLQKQDFDVAFKTRKHISKHHPGNFQSKVLTEYHQNITAINEYILRRINA